MKQIFFNKLRLRSANKERLAIINDILEEYVADGYTLTLRQLYYQLVARDIIPNQQKEYARLSTVLKMGRMAGIVDWDAIEDRVRKPKRPYWVTSIENAVEDTSDQYRLNRMKGQSQKIEVWVEKDALSNILYRVSSKYGIYLMVNRGYSSASAMYDAYNRLDDGDTILYFGDHDPSGLDMIRDISDRLSEFGLNINVKPVALTMEQIKKFNPPPNPAKITDPRADWYISQHGAISWELDALPPQELISIAETEVLKLIDLDIYNRILAQEKADKLELQRKFNID